MPLETRNRVFQNLGSFKSGVVCSVFYTNRCVWSRSYQKSVSYVAKPGTNFNNPTFEILPVSRDSVLPEGHCKFRFEIQQCTYSQASLPSHPFPDQSYYEGGRFILKHPRVVLSFVLGIIHFWRECVEITDLDFRWADQERMR